MSTKRRARSWPPRKVKAPARSAILAQTPPSPDDARFSNFRDFVRQRKDEAARDVRERREQRLRLAGKITDARIRRAFLQREAEIERAIRDFWHEFFRAPMRERKRPIPAAEHRKHQHEASTPIPLASYSGPIIDRRGRRGIYLSASFLGASRASYGCAMRVVYYATGEASVERDADGAALIASNVGTDRHEMVSAMALVEDLNRAARKNAKIVITFIVQLPHDISPRARLEILQRWCTDQFGAHNLPWAAAVHRPDAEGDQRNYHGHVVISFRPLVRVGRYQWQAGRELKTELDNPEHFALMREGFAEVMTEVVQEVGLKRSYTGLSHAARGLKHKPTIHLGGHKARQARAGLHVPDAKRNAQQIRINEAREGVDRCDRNLARLEALAARSRSLMVDGPAWQTVQRPSAMPALPAIQTTIVRSAIRLVTVAPPSIQRSGWRPHVPTPAPPPPQWESALPARPSSLPAPPSPNVAPVPAPRVKTLVKRPSIVTDTALIEQQRRVIAMPSSFSRPPLVPVILPARLSDLVKTAAPLSGGAVRPRALSTNAWHVVDISMSPGRRPSVTAVGIGAAPRARRPFTVRPIEQPERSILPRLQANALMIARLLGLLAERRKKREEALRWRRDQETARRVSEQRDAMITEACRIVSASLEKPYSLKRGEAPGTWKVSVDWSALTAEQRAIVESVGLKELRLQRAVVERAVADLSAEESSGEIQAAPAPTAGPRSESGMLAARHGGHPSEAPLGATMPSDEASLIARVTAMVASLEAQGRRLTVADDMVLLDRVLIEQHGLDATAIASPFVQKQLTDLARRQESEIALVAAHAERHPHHMLRMGREWRFDGHAPRDIRVLADKWAHDTGLQGDLQARVAKLVSQPARKASLHTEDNGAAFVARTAMRPAGPVDPAPPPANAVPAAAPREHPAISAWRDATRRGLSPGKCQRLAAIAISDPEAREAVRCSADPDLRRLIEDARSRHEHIRRFASQRSGPRPR